MKRAPDYTSDRPPGHAVNSPRTVAHCLLAVSSRRVALSVIVLSTVLNCNAQSPRAQIPEKAHRSPAAEKIVESYLKAIGGKQLVATIRDSTYEWQIQLDGQMMGLAKTQTKSPASARLEMTFGNGQMSWGADARSAWTCGLDGQVHAATGEEAEAAKLQALLDARHLVNISESSVLARVVSIKDVDSIPAYVVEFSARNGARLKYLFSTKTNFLVRIEDDARQSSTELEDYRAEDKLLVPHRVRLNIRNTATLTLILQRASYNTGLPDATFAAPRAVAGVGPSSSFTRARVASPAAPAASCLSRLRRFEECNS